MADKDWTGGRSTPGLPDSGPRESRPGPWGEQDQVEIVFEPVSDEQFLEEVNREEKDLLGEEDG